MIVLRIASGLLAVSLLAPVASSDVDRAVQLLDEGRYEEAVAILEEELALDPDRVPALVAMGRAMIAYGEMGRATDYLERAVGLAPDDADANLYLGAALYYRAREAIDEGKLSGYVASLFQDARKALDRALAADEEHLEAYQFLGLVAYWQQDFESAVDAFRRGTEVAPEDPYCFFQLGETYRVQEQYESAIPYYERAVELEPSYAEAHRDIGLCREFLGDRDGAEAAYAEAILAAPGYLEPYKDLWRLYEGEEDVARGVEALERLREDLADAYAVHWYLAHFYARAGRTRDAVDAFERVVELNPASVNAYLEMAKILQADGRFEDAVIRLETGLALERVQGSVMDVSESAFFRELIAVADGMRAAGKVEEAERVLRRLADRAPENGAVWNVMGRVLREAGRYEDSRRAYEKAVERLSLDAQVLNDFGEVLDHHLGRHEEAFAVYKRAVEISENVDAIENLVRFYLRTGQFEEAVRMAERGLRLEPNRMSLRTWLRRAEERLRGGSAPR